MFAAGIGGWAYAKTYRRTGGNAQKSLIAAAIAGVFGFIVILSILSFIPNPSA